MTFLPQKYDVPKSPSDYMKLEEGANRFRILSSAIVGYEYWNTQNKPVRQREPFKLIPDDIKLKEDGMPTDFKHFWAFAVWDYSDKTVKVLEITQSTIQRAMKIKIDNREGNAKGNDFIITKTGKGLLTEYDVDVADPTPVPAEAEIAYRAKPVNLEALYDGGNPFAKVDKEAEKIAQGVDF